MFHYAVEQISWLSNQISSFLNTNIFYKEHAQSNCDSVFILLFFKKKKIELQVIMIRTSPFVWRDQQRRATANLPAVVPAHTGDQSCYKNNIQSPLDFNYPLFIIWAAPLFAKCSYLLHIHCFHINGCEVYAMMHFVISY